MTDTDATQTTTITLRGGRGTVRGELIHINPNYVVLRKPQSEAGYKGCEVYVPQRIIASVKRDEESR